MAKRVIWSKIAIADRISILDYWRQRIGSPTYSIRLNNEIKHVVQLLSQFPSLGRHLENREERFFVVDNYLVICFEAEDHIEILHVWDSRRNPENLVL